MPNRNVGHCLFPVLRPLPSRAKEKHEQGNHGRADGESGQEHERQTFDLEQDEVKGEKPFIAFYDGVKISDDAVVSAFYEGGQKKPSVAQGKDPQPDLLPFHQHIQPAFGKETADDRNKKYQKNDTHCRRLTVEKISAGQVRQRGPRQRFAAAPVFSPGTGTTSSGKRDGARAGKRAPARKRRRL